MINHPPQRKLRRSFGSQPVGCLGGPRQSEAGVAVQVTQAQSSRWTFRSLDVGDLATWRLGDLANPVAGDQRGADPRNLLRPLPRHLLRILHERREVRLSRTSGPRQVLTISSNHPSVSSDFTASHRLVAVKPHFFSLKQRRTNKINLAKIKS